MKKLLIMSALVLLGCPENKRKAPAVVKSSQEQNVKTETAPSVEEVAKPEVEASNDNLFLANIVRDPFSSAQNSHASLESVEKEEHFCEELLCGMELGQLALVAIVSGDASPVAMLEDTQGMGYLVRKNMRIGKRGGRVSSIYQNCLVVSEPSQEMKSGVREQTLCVKSEDVNTVSVDLMNGRQVQ